VTQFTPPQGVAGALAAPAPYQTQKPQPEIQLDTALRLARDHGLYVFPVSPSTHIDAKTGRFVKAKEPYPFFQWRARSTNNPDEIRALWREYPHAAVAIDCGKSELLVIDPDRKPGEPDGVAAWRELFELKQLLHGPVEPPPPVIATANGGEHVWFRQPTEVKLGNSEGSLPEGNNVRGVAGYVVAPDTVIAKGKSIALYSGERDCITSYATELADGRVIDLEDPVPRGRYEVVAGSLSAIPEAPSWLVDMLKPHERLQPSKAALTPDEQEKELIKLRYALPYISAHDGEKTWRPVGMAMRWALGEDGFPLFDEWSRTAPGKYNFDQNVRRWNSFAIPGDGRRDDRTVVNLGTVYHLAEKHGWPGIKGDLALQAELRAFEAAKLHATVKALSASDTKQIEALITSTARCLQRLDRRMKRGALLKLQRQDMAECTERWRSFGEGPRPYRDLDGKVHDLGWHPPKRERPRCGARTRAGGTCKAPALPEKERCRMHGGLSTGPKTAEGKARTLAALQAGFQRYVEERRAQKAASLNDGAAC
jgi:hypothetical protein